MINIADISKPSVSTKGGSPSRKADASNKLEKTEPIDATRKVNESTRRSRKENKQEAVKKKSDAQGVEGGKRTTSNGNDNDDFDGHIDVKV
ncbi:hypothetical protein [Aliikangiella sp. G2MR2-5]|uniref:hypothetical protein n=1 Tax=Aliikangiella sp. G2MR2-5 TaxID=2788943 RepID=UPI0018A95B9E|nr:hypothetical protein [Aliikangiella sp. G2MR2-5]